jgi:ATP-dependent Clp protease protease subunit
MKNLYTATQPFTPITIQKNAGCDIFSALTFRDRLIFLSGGIDDALATSICAQLIFLNNQDYKKDIRIYINSPGGGVYAALAIIDTINSLGCDVQTVAVGFAASAASLILCSGTPGKRFAMPNARIMLHEPWGGFQGRSIHMEDHANEIKSMRKKLHDIYKNSSNKKLKDSELEYYLNRETFFDSETAQKLGLIDEIEKKQTLVNKAKLQKSKLGI